MTDGHAVKMPNPPKRLSAHQVYKKTLNLIFSASKQNIKNLVGNFGAIRAGIMHGKFQPSSFNGVGGGGGGDRRKGGPGMSRHITNFTPQEIYQLNWSFLKNSLWIEMDKILLFKFSFYRFIWSVCMFKLLILELPKIWMESLQFTLFSEIFSHFLPIVCSLKSIWNSIKGLLDLLVNVSTGMAKCRVQNEVWRSLFWLKFNFLVIINKVSIIKSILWFSLNQAKSKPFQLLRDMHFYMGTTLRLYTNQPYAISYSGKRWLDQ